MNCENCAALIRRGEAEELHPACRAGRCADPPDRGGLGVVRLHPVNALAVRFWHLCASLGEPLALRLGDPTRWGVSPDLLARQLEQLVEAWGAPWRPALSPRPLEDG